MTKWYNSILLIKLLMLAWIHQCWIELVFWEVRMMVSFLCDILHEHLINVHVKYCQLKLEDKGEGWLWTFNNPPDLRKIWNSNIFLLQKNERKRRNGENRSFSPIHIELILFQAPQGNCVMIHNWERKVKELDLNPQHLG